MPGRGLANSRWARPGTAVLNPAPHRSTTGPSPPASPARGQDQSRVSLPRIPRPGAAVAAQELSRYQKIVRRLKWKAQFLDLGYSKAVARAGAAEAAEAELMFKLDFFEYYMLLERALVHLQGVFGYVISKDFGGRRNQGSSGGGVGNTPLYAHAYHHNVLAALGDPTSPLHDVLGRGDVMRQLIRAKQLRNRWKNADDEDEGSAAAAGPEPLETYDLSNILTTVFAGFDTAYVIADGFVAELNSQTVSWADRDMAEDIDMPAWNEVARGPLPSEQDQWDFMVEAMDWEAV